MARQRETSAPQTSGPEAEQTEWVVLGRVSGLFGVKGWVKVFSDTQPRQGIVDYPVWYLGEEHRPYPLKQGKAHGKSVVALLEGVDDRDQAAALLESEIAIPRSQLPEAGDDEYYWADLEGLQVVTREGVELGQVDYLFETGANDVMVVQGERQRLLPFIADVVLEVSLPEGRILVDWDPEF